MTNSLKKGKIMNGYLDQIFENPEHGKEITAGNGENKANIVIATIRANEQQVITERELARVIGCQNTALAMVRERHADRFTILDAAQSVQIQPFTKCERLVLTLKLKADDGKKRDQLCYSPKAALEVCRHLRFAVADEVMDKLYELAEQKPVSPTLPLTGDKLILAAITELQARIEQQDKLITEQKPKAEYFDKLVERGCNSNFRDTAKELKLKQNEFIACLLKDKYIYRDQKNALHPYSHYHETADNPKGYFVIKDFSARHNEHAGQQCLITPRGKSAFQLLYGRTEPEDNEGADFLEDSSADND